MVIIVMLTLSTLLGVLIFGSDHAISDQIIGEGDITGEVTWNETSSPYYIEGNVTVLGNLTIEPGVEVRSNGNYSLVIEGNLTAVGNASSMITFTSNTTAPEVNNWFKIQVNSTGNITARYCDMSYCWYAI